MRNTLVSLSVLLVLAVPGVALADSNAVITDCADDGRLQGDYSRSELQQARENLPADLDEYSDCRDVINDALTGRGGDRSSGAGGAGSGTGGTGAPPADAHAAAEDATALERATSGDRPKIEVGGGTIEPGAKGLDRSSAANGIPTPLLLALIGLGVLGLGGAVVALRRRVPLLARVPLPRVSLPRVSLPRLRR